jgi:hypothetical protein
MFINSGKSLLSLNLKGILLPLCLSYATPPSLPLSYALGCINLTVNTINVIALYCTALKHFGMWDAPANIMTKVASTISVFTYFSANFFFISFFIVI